MYAIAFLVGCAVAAVIVRRAYRADQHELARLYMLEVCADVELAQIIAGIIR